LTEVERLDVAEHTIPFHNKAKNKKQDPTKLMDNVLSKEAAFKRDWDKKLASQIHDLPPYDTVF